MGAAPSQRRTVIKIKEPLIIEGKLPAESKAPGAAPVKKGFDWRALPWKWIVAGVAVGGVLYLASKKKRGGPRVVIG